VGRGQRRYERVGKVEVGLVDVEAGALDKARQAPLVVYLVVHLESLLLHLGPQCSHRRLHLYDDDDDQHPIPHLPSAWSCVTLINIYK
jgi:hypothetical protein